MNTSLLFIILYYYFTASCFSGYQSAARHSDTFRERRVVVVRGFHQPEPHIAICDDVSSIEIQIIPKTRKNSTHKTK